MSWLRRQLDRAADLSPRDDPRKIAVGRRTTVAARPVVSTPGARVRIVRATSAPELQLVVLWCHRHGIAAELTEGEPALLLDGRPISVDALRRHSPDELGSAR